MSNITPIVAVSVAAAAALIFIYHGSKEPEVIPAVHEPKTKKQAPLPPVVEGVKMDHPVLRPHTNNSQQMIDAPSQQEDTPLNLPVPWKLDDIPGDEDTSHWSNNEALGYGAYDHDGESHCILDSEPLQTAQRCNVVGDSNSVCRVVRNMESALRYSK
jgi:hypothetical protein